MNLTGNDKRSGIRLNKEIAVGVRTNKTMSLAYMIDLSRDGMKIGSPILSLLVGEPVVLMVEKSGTKALFSGKVMREDGVHYINRINRSGNAFYIRIEDANFPRFVADNFFVY